MTDEKRRRTDRPILGVLGGMGPAATVDFYRKLVAATPAAKDQEHHRIVIVADPTVPDRSDALLSGRGAAVLEALLQGLHRLQRLDVDAIAIPCNTAHYWLGELRDAIDRPILSIASAAADSTVERFGADSKVAILGTAGTMSYGVYDEALDSARLQRVQLLDSEADAVQATISDVKGGRVERARAALDGVLASVGARSNAVILACTELPIAAGDRLAADSRLIDSTNCLVGACLRWLDGHRR